MPGIYNAKSAFANAPFSHFHSFSRMGMSGLFLFLFTIIRSIYIEIYIIVKNIYFLLFPAQTFN